MTKFDSTEEQPKNSFFNQRQIFSAAGLAFFAGGVLGLGAAFGLWPAVVASVGLGLAGAVGYTLFNYFSGMSVFAGGVLGLGAAFGLWPAVVASVRLGLAGALFNYFFGMSVVVAMQENKGKDDDKEKEGEELKSSAQVMLDSGLFDGATQKQNVQTRYPETQAVERRDLACQKTPSLFSIVGSDVSKVSHSFMMHP